MTPAIDLDTLLLPFLNGFDHLDVLESRYPGQVLGGLVKIVATVDDSGAIVQMMSLSMMTIGSLDGSDLPADPRISPSCAGHPRATVASDR